MFKQFIDKIAGDEIYLIISLLIFFIFFIGMALLLIKMNKKHITYMRNLPLNDDKQEVSYETY